MRGKKTREVWCSDEMKSDKATKKVGVKLSHNIVHILAEPPPFSPHLPFKMKIAQINKIDNALNRTVVKICRSIRHIPHAEKTLSSANNCCQKLFS